MVLLATVMTMNSEITVVITVLDLGMLHPRYRQTCLLVPVILQPRDLVT